MYGQGEKKVMKKTTKTTVKGSKVSAPAKQANKPKRAVERKVTFDYPRGSVEVVDSSIRGRLAFAGVGETELGIVAYWRDVCLAKMDVLVEHFYGHVTASAETRAVIDKHTTVERQKPMLVRYLTTFFGGKVDDAYLELRKRVSARHDEIDLDPVRYMAMYRLIQLDCVAAVAAQNPPAEELERFRQAFAALVQIDVALVVDGILTARLARNLAMVEEQKRKAREAEGVQSAIDRAMAVVELDLDGIMLSANSKFLASTGYELSEVKGRHHRMLCEESYGSSAEYRSFWERLARGEAQAGTTRLVGRGGRALWFQGSYSAILDESGKPIRVVNFAVDVTAQRLAQNEVEAAMVALADGDLTQTIRGDYEGDYLRIKESINTGLDRLSEAMIALRQVSDTVASSASELSAGSQSLAQGANEQSSALQDVSSRLDSMATSTRQSADNAATAKGLADDARAATERGHDAVKRMSQAIDDIKNSSDETGKIVKTIDEIAFQTNLLALNAAVEAARAGDAGRGFAVVAEEVRNLAQRSAEAAKTTAQMIEQAVKSADRGVKLSEEVERALTEIRDGSKKVDHLVAEIAAASAEQSRGLEALNSSVSELSKVTEQNSANAEQSASLAEELGSQASELAERVGSFEVGEDSGDGARGRTAESAGRRGAPSRGGRDARRLGASSGSERNAKGGRPKPRAFGRPQSSDEPSGVSVKRPSASKAGLNGHGKVRADELIPLDDSDLADF
jgi:PAS domain S-box-containing protein